MQLSHSQKHVRVVDELISWSIVPRKGFPDLARLRVAVGPLQRSWAETGGLVSNPALQTSG